MSNHLISAVYKRDLRTPMRKSVMALLADKASDDGAGIYASKQTMADELCCSKQAIIDTIKGFLAEGLLVELGLRRAPNGHTVEYGIVVAALEAVPLVRCHAEREARRSTSQTGQPTGPVKQVDRSTKLTPPVKQVDPNPPEPSSPKASPSPRDAADASGDGQARLLPQHVLEAWNEMAERTGLSKARMTDERRKKLTTAIRRWSLEDFGTALNRIEQSAWLRGENDRGWRVHFDFLLQPSSFVRLIEGNYGS